MGADAITPLVTGGGVFAVCALIIAYLLAQNWKLTARLSEVQDQVARAAEDRTERAGQRIAELEAMLRVTNPHNRSGAEHDDQ